MNHLTNFEVSDLLLAGIAPLIRKMIQSLGEKYPWLYPYATLLTVVLGTVVVALSKGLPVLMDRWSIPSVFVEESIKGGLALAGISNVYNDWRMSKEAATIESIAVAKEASPEVVKHAEKNPEKVIK